MGGDMRLRNKKTGEIKEWEFVGAIIRTYACASGSRLMVCKDPYTKYGRHYDSLAALNDEWEDYKPAEPLIKDEKVRKAVRAWAEANDIEDGITYLDNGEFRSYLNTTIDFAILVDEHRFDLLKKSEEYTITELCGEEEE